MSSVTIEVDLPEDWARFSLSSADVSVGYIFEKYNLANCLFAWQSIDCFDCYIDVVDQYRNWVEIWRNFLGRFNREERARFGWYGERCIHSYIR
jgi:hypothetical protein